MLDLVRAVRELVGNARTRTFLTTLGELLGAAGDLAPELCSCLDEPVTLAALEAGCPVLLLAAVVSVQNDGDKEWWTAERCHAAARALVHYVGKEGLGGGIRAYCAGAGDRASAMASNIAGNYFLLSARSADVRAFSSIAEAL